MKKISISAISIPITVILLTLVACASQATTPTIQESLTTNQPAPTQTTTPTTTPTSIPATTIETTHIQSTTTKPEELSLPVKETVTESTAVPTTPSPTLENAELATIAFVRFEPESGAEYICLIKADGTGLKKLTLDKDVSEIYPQFSPDGKKIVFSRWLNTGVSNIWVMNVDGSSASSLTNDRVSDMPAWSPDGKLIAFMSMLENQSEIFVMASNGLNRKRLTNDPALDMLPVWSPDGAQIAFLSNRGGIYRWWVINADGSDQRLLADIKVYDEDLKVPYFFLRGTWSRMAHKGYFLTPQLTGDEEHVISIDISKGEAGFITYKGCENIIEVYGASGNSTTSIIGTIWNPESDSFDMVDVFSEARLITSSPEEDFASSCMVLPP